MWAPLTAPRVYRGSRPRTLVSRSWRKRNGGRSLQPLHLSNLRDTSLAGTEDTCGRVGGLIACNLPVVRTSRLPCRSAPTPGLLARGRVRPGRLRPDFGEQRSPAWLSAHRASGQTVRRLSRGIPAGGNRSRLPRFYDRADEGSRQVLGRGDMGRRTPQCSAHQLRREPRRETRAAGVGRAARAERWPAPDAAGREGRGRSRPSSARPRPRS
jgi:hypothetical protein